MRVNGVVHQKGLWLPDAALMGGDARLENFRQEYETELVVDGDFVLKFLVYVPRKLLLEVDDVFEAHVLERQRSAFGQEERQVYEWVQVFLVANEIVGLFVPYVFDDFMLYFEG